MSQFTIDPDGTLNLGDCDLLPESCGECEGGRVSKLVQAGALEWPEDRPCPSCSVVVVPA